MSAFSDFIATARASASKEPAALIPATGTVTLPPSAWTTEWKTRPREPVTVGLRLISTNELLAAQHSAARRCIDMVDTGESELAAAYNAELAAEILAVALCSAADVTKPFWEGAQPDYVRTRLTSAGLARVFDAWRMLDASLTPIGDQADDVEIAAIASMVGDETLLADLDAESEAYVRRAFAMIWSRING